MTQKNYKFEKQVFFKFNPIVFTIFKKHFYPNQIIVINSFFLHSGEHAELPNQRCRHLFVFEERSQAGIFSFLQKLR